MFSGLKKNTVVENATVQSYPPNFVLGKEWISFGCALKIIYHDYYTDTGVSQQRGFDGKISFIIIACDADSKKNQNFTTTTHKGTSHYHIFNRTEGMGMGMGVRYLTLVPGRFLLHPTNGTSSTDLGRLQLSRSSNDNKVHVLHLSGNKNECMHQGILPPSGSTYIQ